MDRRIIAQLFDSIDSLIQASKEFYQRPQSTTASAANDTPVPSHVNATMDALSAAGDANASSGTIPTQQSGANNNSNGEKATKSGFVVLIVATNK